MPFSFVFRRKDHIRNGKAMSWLWHGFLQQSIIPYSKVMVNNLIITHIYDVGVKSPSIVP